MMKCMHEWAVKHGLVTPLQAEMPLDDPRLEPDEEDDFEDFFEEHCDTCDGFGVVNCYCGGDICVCRHNGEKPCPDCDNY